MTLSADIDPSIFLTINSIYINIYIYSNVQCPFSWHHLSKSENRPVKHGQMDILNVKCPTKFLRCMDIFEDWGKEWKAFDVLLVKISLDVTITYFEYLPISLNHQWTFCTPDKRILLLGFAHACLQFSIAIFWILWAPTLVVWSSSIPLTIQYCYLNSS